MLQLHKFKQSNAHRGFGFVEFLETEDAAAAIDNMHNAEMYGKVLRVNYAKPLEIKGGEKGFSNLPVWADADTWLERQQQEAEIKRWTAAEAQAAQQGAGADRAGDPMQELEEQAEQEEDV